MDTQSCSPASDFWILEVCVLHFVIGYCSRAYQRCLHINNSVESSDSKCSLSRADCAALKTCTYPRTRSFYIVCIDQICLIVLANNLSVTTSLTVIPIL